MDFDAALLEKVISGGMPALRQVERMGVKPELLRGVSSEALKFVSEYAEKHGELPGQDLVKHSTGMTIGAPAGANVEHLVEHVMRRHLWRVERLGAEKLLEAIENKDPEKAKELILELANDVQGVRSGTSAKVKNLFDTGDDVLDLYMRTKAGEIGVPFPWPTMNEMTMGLWPGTVTLFFARPGTGKTFVIVIAARHAHKLGYESLIVSPEMSAPELGERFFAVDGGLSYRDIVGGQLGAFQEEKLKANIEASKAKTGINVIDDDRDLRPDVIEEAVMDLKPAVVYIDSLYDIRMGKGDRSERMAQISEWLRKLAKRCNVPVVSASQFNRSQEGSKSAKMAGAALSDQLAWDAHNMIGLVQTQDMRDDGILRFEPMKVRRGASAKKLTCRWDFDAMDFEEIDAQADSSFSDDDAEEISSF